MRRYRNALIYLAIYIILGGAWLYVSAWRLFAWPLVLAGSFVVAALSDLGQWAITWRLDRPKSARQRDTPSQHRKPAER